ncbi:SDR family oxidoreductase [Salinibacterium sp. ZJ454]|uniref:SDR family NAD(P)-dependent oxidoreductase n=1 Tax=Salinibacterium sp. ZJ454 TaxID=2708339 RepID=UPI00142404AC|nr:SDR family oxidoreductase [Salinibacterium sp. ZJ454]
MDETLLAARVGLRAGSLTGRVAVVTGAASGIGLVTAQLLMELGCTVAAVDRAPKSGIDHAHDFPVDLYDPASVPALWSDVVAKVGAPSILVNAAGVTGERMLETSLEDWRKVMELNLTSPFVLIQEFAKTYPESASHGAVVNIGSSSAYRAVSNGGAYGASKSGLASLTRSAAWELGPRGVNVNLVAPGVTRTPLAEAALGGDPSLLDKAALEGPLANLVGRASEPIDVAAIIAMLCLPASRQVTGQTIHVSGGAVVSAG